MKMKKGCKIMAMSLLAISLLGSSVVYGSDKGVDKEFTVEVLPNNTGTERNFEISSDINSDTTKNKRIEKNFEIDGKRSTNSSEGGFEVGVKEKKEDNKVNSKVDNKKSKEVNNVTREDVRELLEEYRKENIRNNVNPLATPQSSARGRIIENVGSDNKPYPIRRNIEDKRTEIKDSDKNKGNNDGSGMDRKKADARQFLTFQTKSGKVFHLIVDHDNNSENVSLVTEVSEADLLNMIETDSGKEDIKSQIEVKKEEIKETPQKTEPKKKSIGSFLILSIVFGGAIGAGYYFKIVKPKRDEVFDEDELEDEEDFFDNEEGDDFKKETNIDESEDENNE